MVVVQCEWQQEWDCMQNSSQGVRTIVDPLADRVCGWPRGSLVVDVRELVEGVLVNVMDLVGVSVAHMAVEVQKEVLHHFRYCLTAHKTGGRRDGVL